MASDLGSAAQGRITSAYAILRAQPDLGLDGFAARLEIDVTEAADLLDQLVDLSLVRRDTDAALVPTAPLAAMQQIIHRERAALDARRRSLDESYAMLAGVIAEMPQPAAVPSFGSPVGPHLVGGSGSGVAAERLEGVAVVRQRLQRLADQARQEVLSFAPTARNPTDARAASRRPDLEVLARGVVTRTIYLDSIVGEPQALAYATELVAAGGHVRLLPALPIRLIIVDRKVAAVPIDPQDATVGALILHDIGTVSAMVALFEAYWRDGRPIPGERPTDDYSAMDITILRLLASGAKDEAVARQLGVSVRTVRRAIATLMERLNADSRFALGIHAAERGLLD